MSLRKLMFGLSACLLLSSGVTVNVRAQLRTKIRSVDCFSGESINKALENRKDLDKLLTIEITGICDEDVLVQRDNVRLIGLNLDLTDPDNPIPTDGIRAVSTDPNAPPTFGVALWIRDAANVTVKDLRIFGAARHGLRVTNSRPLILVENCRLEGNANRGLSVADSNVTVQDTTLTGNDGGGATLFGAVAIFDNCIFDEDGVAVTAGNHSTDRLRDSTVTSGAYRANRKSIIELENTDQIVNPSQNLFTSGSQLTAGPPSSIQGPSTFTNFSSGFLGSVGGGNVATHSGNITCRSLSDLFCPDPASIIDGGVTLGCASCIVP